MVVKLVFQFTFLLLLMFQLAKAAAPIAKPNCPDHCGNNISIPYPFGIGKGCYLDQWYEITCNETANPPTAFINSINMEVLNFSVEEGRAYVKGPIISSNCSNRKASSPVNLTGSPFLFSYSNEFVAVGCNTRALLTEIGSELVGCDSTCGTVQENSFYSCKNCCHATIPTELQVFNPSLVTTPNGENQGRGGCRLGFLVHRPLYNMRDLQGVQDLEYVPVTLVWGMNDSSWKYDYRSMACNQARYNGTGYECRCWKGSYEGNPYLGCIDIDECKDPRKNLCRGITTCVNKRGTYKCEVNKVWIVLIVVGAVIGALSLLTGLWWLYKYITRRNRIELKKKFFKRNGGLLLQQQVSSSDDSVSKTKIYTSKELEKATDRFNEDRILGQGGQGTVYKGMLVDGRIVAVKKSKIVDEEKLDEFINEVVILSQINHRNVVKLLGCCLETEVPLLVYEFIPNGNLFQYLHGQNEETFLSWEMRLQIATEVAGALSYLHSAASVPIYHRDIKSTNILLDEKYRAKVSDFGTSRSIAIDQTHLTTHVQGTFGYLDPEYFQSSQFTDKSDVYSFGVVLVELLSGQKPIFSASHQETRSLATHFILLMEDNKVFNILDARVKEHCCNEEVIAVANLAKRCLNLNGKNRPTMKHVTTELERIRLSRKGLIGQQNSEEIEITVAEVINEWDATSTSITSGFDSGRVLSSDDEPLITYKSW